MLDITRAYGLDFRFPERDEAVGRCLRSYGEFARVEIDLIADYLGEAGTVIDIGANIGAICLPLAKRFPQHWFVAVEGHGGLAQVLSTNAYANDLYNVEVVHAAAGPESRIARFPSVRLGIKGNFGTMGVHTADTGPRTANVRMLTLDEIAPDDTRFVKIDVEGFEPSVLKGAGRVLETLRPTWLIEAARTYEGAARETIQTMLDADYDLYWLFAPFVTKAHPKHTGAAPMPQGDHDILAVPKGGPNLWDLEPILSADVEFPRHIDRFPYLKRYGF